MIDQLIAYFSPQSAVNRLQARRLLAYYEATKPSRTRTNRGDNASGNRLAQQSAAVLRGQARHLEQNHDLAKAVLRELVNKTVGAKGIQVECLARKASGEIDMDFAKRINDLWKSWCQTCDVSGENSFSMAQRLLAYSKYRDGEVFNRLVSGNVPGLLHATSVPLSIQPLESDFVPFLDDLPNNVVQGVKRNEWGKILSYQAYRHDPRDAYQSEYITIFANNMGHAKNVERIGQLRGVSKFAQVLNRLNDLKDYEDSERVAARISASMAAYIKKGTPDLYDADEATEDRELDIQSGMIFDGLFPGEDVGTLQSNRPSQLLQPFRDSMLKAVASGTGAGYSPVSNNYDGTYSSQRQQLIDNWINYEVLQDEFIHQIVRPVYERFVSMAVASGAVNTRGLNMETLKDADYRGPVMPWIDPLKEANAHVVKLAARLVSPQKVMRQAGDNPNEVLNQFKQFIDQLDKLGLQKPEYLADTPPNPTPDQTA